MQGICDIFKTFNEIISKIYNLKTSFDNFPTATNFPDWCTLGHLEFEFDYGDDGKEKSQLYNFLIEQE